MTSTTAQHGGGKTANGGRFDFDDGGTYCGGWEDGKAHGHGVCTGPKGQGEYSGSWHFGFEVSGIYTWPSGSTYEGQWQNGKRHGLGIETRGRWLYRGEWTQGFKGRYGVRQSKTSVAKYEGTWANGLQDGYGSETYADTGTFKGQWLRGLRHGYGVRTSAQFRQASSNHVKQNKGSSSSDLRSENIPTDPITRDRKMDDGSRGGFVLRVRSDESSRRRGSLSDKPNLKNVFRGLKMRRQRSTGDIGSGARATGSIRSTSSSTSWVSTDSGHSAYTVGDVPEEGSNASFIVEDEHLDGSTVETYLGEWKNDKRCGFGTCERSDGVKYEGEWYNNKKYGYGITTFKDGAHEEGKYKNNVLITSNKRKHVFLIRSAKFKERIEGAVAAAQRASKIAMQKEDIAISRTATARGKAEQADIAAAHSYEDSDMARVFAKQFAPDFKQPGSDARKTYPNKSKLMVESNDIRALKHDAEVNNPKARHNHVNSNHKPKPFFKHDDIMEDYSPRDHDDFSSEMNPSANYNEYGEPDKHLEQPSSSGYNAQINSRFSDSTDHISSRKGSAPDFRSSNQSNHRISRTSNRIPNTALNDRYDHYNRPPSRPPSRDRSVDSFSSRTQTPLNTQLGNHSRSRAPSAQKVIGQDWTPDSGVFEDEMSSTVITSRRSSKPTATLTTSEQIPNVENSWATVQTTRNIPSNPKEAESFLRQRACGQEIPPPSTSLGFKRTESLYINPLIRRQAESTVQTKANPVKRKKSLPEAAQPMNSNVPIMPREQASVLSSHQREIRRKQEEDSQRYRANPLLYLTSPSVQEWFSRQRLVMLILFLNLTLALMFFKLLS